MLETVPVAMRSGEAPYRTGSWPDSVSALWTTRDTARVTWSDGSPPEELNLALAEGANERLTWWNGEYPDNVTPIREDARVVAVEVSGLRPAGRYRMLASGGASFHLEPPVQTAGSPVAPSNVGARVTGPDSVRLTWRDSSNNETGFEVWYRKWSGDDPVNVWRRYGQPLPAGTRSVEVAGLVAEDKNFRPGYSQFGRNGWVQKGRYSFVVVAENDKGFSASESFEFEFMPGPHRQPTASGHITNCSPRHTGVDLDGYEVLACFETPDGARQRMWDYRLGTDQSALLYFFGRDNVELLVKVLDGCAINGHRWVFVAPVTTLGFRLVIQEASHSGRLPSRQIWHYDSKRRTQDQIDLDPLGRVGNPVDSTAVTVSDTTAFPCTPAETAAAKAQSSDAGGDSGVLALDVGSLRPSATSTSRLSAGAATDCGPGAPVLTLEGGYTVSMCYETYDGLVGGARDWGLDSSQSGLLYFFDRDNAEVLIKVLDGCGVNGHRWVFVAPVTDLAFRLRVESPDGQRWTHTNGLGQTADAASDVSAFPCASSA